MVLLAAGCAVWGQNNCGGPQHGRSRLGLLSLRAGPHVRGVGRRARRTRLRRQGHRELQGSPQGRPRRAPLSEELADFYVQVGTAARGARRDAEEALQANPNDLAALRLLARIYTSQIGGAAESHQRGHAARRPSSNIKKITELAPKDVDALGDAGPAGEGGAGQCRGREGVQESAGSRPRQRRRADRSVAGLSGSGQQPSRRGYAEDSWPTRIPPRAACRRWRRLTSRCGNSGWPPMR